MYPLLECVINCKYISRRSPQSKFQRSLNIFCSSSPQMSERCHSFNVECGDIAALRVSLLTALKCHKVELGSETATQSPTLSFQHNN